MYTSSPLRVKHYSRLFLNTNFLQHFIVSTTDQEKLCQQLASRYLNQSLPQIEFSKGGLLSRMLNDHTDRKIFTNSSENSYSAEHIIVAENTIGENRKLAFRTDDLTVDTTKEDYTDVIYPDELDPSPIFRAHTREFPQCIDKEPLLFICIKSCIRSFDTVCFDHRCPAKLPLTVNAECERDCHIEYYKLLGIEWKPKKVWWEDYNKKKVIF